MPSLDAYVTLRRTLEAPTVSLTQEHWSTLVAVAGGATVRAIADELSLPEIPVSRAVRDLVEVGVVEIEAAAPAGTAEVPVAGAAVPAPVLPAAAELAPLVVDLPAPAPEHEAPWMIEEDAPSLSDPMSAHADSDDELEALPTARPLRARRSRSTTAGDDGPHDPERFVPLDLPHMATSPAASRAAADDDAGETDEPGLVDDLAAAFPGLANRSAALSPEDEELARQLATLSPRAAQAVRAAAEAGTDEERDAALDAAEEGEDAPINRGLLLKFLSSVKS